MMSLSVEMSRRYVLAHECEKELTSIIARINLLREEKEVQLGQMRDDVSQFLQTGQEARARIRVEHIIREEDILGAYETLDYFCNFVLDRINLIEGVGDCPGELQRPIASIIFTASRCSDFLQLMHIEYLFTEIYGKEFAISASELQPESNVCPAIIERLSGTPPSAETKLRTLLEIAGDHNLEWDPSAMEQVLFRTHEDLQDARQQHQQALSTPPLVLQDDMQHRMRSARHMRPIRYSIWLGAMIWLGVSWIMMSWYQSRLLWAILYVLGFVLMLMCFSFGY